MARRSRPTETRRLKLTVAGVAAVLGLALLTIVLLPDPNADDHLEAAREFQRTGDLAAAELSFKNALALDPANAEARWELASLYLRLGHGYAARIAFEQASAQGYSGDGAETALLRARMLTGEHLNVVEELSRQTGTAKSLPLSTLLAEALTGVEQYEEAEQILAGAKSRFGSDDPGLQRVEMKLAVARNQALRAAEIYNASDALTEPTAENLRLKGEFELMRRDGAAALTAYRKALELDPFHLDGQFGVIRAQITTNQFKEAEAALQQIFEQRPRDPRVDYLQGLVAYRKADLTTAKAKLHQVLGMAPRHLASVVLLGSIHIAAKEYDAAEALLEKALANAEDFVTARMLLATVHLEKSDGAKAIKVLTPMLDAGEHHRDLYVLMSRAHRLEDDLKSSFSYLVRAHLLAGDLDKARESAEDFARDQPDSAVPLIFMGSIHEQQKNELGARAVYEEAMLIDPSDPAGALNLARLDARSGDLEAAKLRYEGVLRISPNELAALIGLALVELSTNNRERAVELLEQARKHHSKALEPRLRLINHYLSAAKPKVALTIAREATAIAPRDPGTILGLARTQGAAGATGAALRTLGNLLKDHPKFSDAYAEQGRLFESLGRTEEARVSFRKAIDNDASRQASRVALTRLEIRTGEYDRAAALVLELKAAHPEESLPFELEGGLFLAQQKLDEALGAFEQAFERSPTGRTLLKRVNAHRARGEPDVANKLLTDWMERHPDDVLIELAIAQTAQTEGRASQAEKAYRRILAKAPDFVPALNNLGMLILETSPAKGQELIARAYELAPTNPIVMDSYGWLLVQQDKLEDAISLLRATVRQAPELPAAKYHLAVALTKSNLKVSAQRLLTELLESKRAFGDRDSAATLLTELKGG